MFVDLLEPERTAFGNIGNQLAQRILLDLMLQEKRKDGRGAMYSSFIDPRYYKPVMPTLSGGCFPDSTRWARRDDPTDRGSGGVDVHPST